MFANCFQYAPISMFFSVAGTFASWDKRALPKNYKNKYIPATMNPAGKISNILPKNICDAFKSYLFERWNASLFIKKFKVCSSYAMKLGLTLSTKNLQHNSTILIATSSSWCSMQTSFRAQERLMRWGSRIRNRNTTQIKRI